METWTYSVDEEILDNIEDYIDKHLIQQGIAKNSLPQGGLRFIILLMDQRMAIL